MHQHLCQQGFQKQKKEKGPKKYLIKTSLKMRKEALSQFQKAEFHKGKHKKAHDKAHINQIHKNKENYLKSNKIKTRNPRQLSADFQ